MAQFAYFKKIMIGSYLEHAGGTDLRSANEASP